MHPDLSNAFVGSSFAYEWSLETKLGHGWRRLGCCCPPSPNCLLQCKTWPQTHAGLEPCLPSQTPRQQCWTWPLWGSAYPLDQRPRPCSTLKCHVSLQSSRKLQHLWHEQLAPESFRGQNEPIRQQERDPVTELAHEAQQSKNWSYRPLDILPPWSEYLEPIWRKLVLLLWFIWE